MSSVSIGGAISSAGTLVAGEQQARLYEANAKVARRDAQMARDAAGARANDIIRESNRFKASQRAQAAAQGAVTTEGSPLGLMMDTARESRRAVSRTLYAGAVEAARNIFTARVFETTAENTRIVSYISAVAQIFGGSAVQPAQPVIPQQQPGGSQFYDRTYGMSQDYINYRAGERRDYTGYINPSYDLSTMPSYGGNYNPPASIDAGAYDAGGAAGAY